MNGWLSMQLQQCCDDLEVSYMGLIMMQQFRLDELNTVNDMLLNSLWIFKADQSSSDPAQQRAQWSNDYVAANYVAPTNFPVASIVNWIDVPPNCDSPTVQEKWDELYTMVTSILLHQDLSGWLATKLAECDDVAENTIDQRIALNSPRLEQLKGTGMAIDTCLVDLIQLLDIDQTLDEYKTYLKGIFDSQYNNNQIAREPTGIVIPDVPESADEETKEARALLVQLNKDLQYYLTFKEFLRQLVQPACEVIVGEIEGLIDLQRLFAAGADNQNAVSTLWSLKESDQVNPVDIGTFRSDQAVAFALDQNKPVVTTGIVIPTPPLVCSVATAEALSDLNNYNDNLYGLLQYKAWLQVKIDECCFLLEPTLSDQQTMKAGMLQDSNSKNAQKTATITSISDMTAESLMQEFIDVGVATADVMWDVMDVPMGCSPAVVTIHENLVNTCELLNMSLDFGVFLDAKRVIACDNQQWRLIDLIQDNTPRLTAGDAEKNNLYMTWWELEKSFATQTFEQFKQEKELYFDSRYATDPTQFTPVATGIAIEDVPGGEFGCSTHQVQQRVELVDLDGMIKKYETYCKWVEENTMRVCEEQKDQILAIHSNHLQDLTDSQERVIRLLIDLDTLKGEQPLMLGMTFFQLIEFQWQSVKDNMQPEIPDIFVPTVPPNAKQEVHDAVTLLQGLKDDISDSLTYEKWLDEMLQMYCDNIAINISEVTGLLSDCNVDNSNFIMETYSLVDFMMDQQMTFLEYKEAVCDEYDRFFEQTAMILVPTNVDIPLVPAGCNSIVQAQVAGLKAEDKSFGQCLTKQEWINEQQQDACNESVAFFENLQIHHSFRLESDQISFTNNLDDLYVCSDPGTTFMAFMNQFISDNSDITPKPSGVFIPPLPAACRTGTLASLEGDLQQLQMDIGLYKALVSAVKEGLDTCLVELDNTFGQLRTANAQRFQDASNNVASLLDSLFPIVKNPTEMNDQSFRNWIEQKFKLDFDPENPGVTLVPDIVIQELPQQATPANIFQRNRLVEERNQLIEDLAYTEWLIAKITQYCQARLDLISDVSVIVDRDGRNIDAVNVHITDILSPDLQSLKDPDGMLPAAIFQALRESDSNGHPLVESGLTVPEAPATCPNLAELLAAQTVWNMNNDNLEARLTVEDYFKDKIEECCTLQLPVLQNSIAAAEQELPTAQMNNLEAFMMLTGETEAGCRTVFEDAKPFLTPNTQTVIGVPVVPATCPEANSLAAMQLQVDVNEINEEYLFGQFIELKLSHVWNGLAQAMANFIAASTNVIDPTSSEYGLLGMFNALSPLQATPGQTLQDFIAQVMDDFNNDPNASQNLPLTGVPTCPLPNNCAGAPQNVLDAQDALQAFLPAYQAYFDFGSYVQQRLASANDMAEDACNDLAQEFNIAFAANSNRIAEEIARQDFLIGELFTKEVDPTLLSMPAFVSNTRQRFENAGSPSIPLDILNPVVPTSCDTFSTATTNAANKLQLRRNQIQPHWDYSQWLEEELQACCEIDYNDYIARTDQPSLEACMNTVEWQLIDMYQFDGAGYATQQDFDAFFLDCFDMARQQMFFDSASIECTNKGYSMTVNEAADDVGAVQPYLDSCETLPSTEDIYMKRLELLTYKVRIQDCRTMRDWIQDVLNQRCEPLALQINLFLQDKVPIINAALSVQPGLVTDLYVFKDILDSNTLEPEEIGEFFARIKETFTMDFTQRLDAGYTIDQFEVPHMCTEAVTAFNSLTALYDRTRFELTFNQFLTISLEECCETTFLQTRDDLIPEAVQTISDLTDQRQCLYEDLHQCKAIPDARRAYIEALDLEYVTGKLDETIIVYPRSAIFVQPSEDGCSTQPGYIYDQQDILRAKITIIDDLIAQTEWLQEKLDVCCVQHQGLWQTIIDDNTLTLIDCLNNSEGIITFDLHFMEGVDDAENTLVAPSTALNPLSPDFIAFIGEQYEEAMVPVNVKLTILPAPLQDKCPPGPTATWGDANKLARNINECDAREDWLEARRTDVCLRQYAELESTFDAAEKEYQVGTPPNVPSIAAELALHMGQGIQIVGNSGEPLINFEIRMRDEWTDDDTAAADFITANNDLPAFSGACQEYLSKNIPPSYNVVQRIGDTVTQVNRNKEDKALTEWAIDHFTIACRNFGSTNFVDVKNASAQVNRLNAAQTAKTVLTNKWKQVDDDMKSWNGMTPATYSEFKQGQFNVTVIPLSTDVDAAMDYPAPCDIYTANDDPTILDQQTSLQAQVDMINYCETFNDWALAGMQADRKTLCDNEVFKLNNYTQNTLTPMLQNLLMDINSRIENFLYILDPAAFNENGNPRFSDADFYRSQVLNGAYALNKGNAVEPMVHTDVVTFPMDVYDVDICLTDLVENPNFYGQNRTDAIASFNSEAAAIALQQQFLNWINARIDEVCDHHLGLLLTQHTELTNAKPGSDNMHASMITLNYNLLVQNDPTQVATYPDEATWWTDKGQVDWAAANPSYSYNYVDYEVIDIPDDYCEQIVAAAIVDELQRNVYQVMADNTVLVNHLNPQNRQIEWMMSLYTTQCGVWEVTNYQQVLLDNAFTQAAANTAVEDRIAAWYAINLKQYQLDNVNNKNNAGAGELAHTTLISNAFITCQENGGFSDDTCLYKNSPDQVPIPDAPEVWTQCNSVEYDPGFDDDQDDIDVRKTVTDAFIFDWKQDLTFMNWSRLKLIADENEYCIALANALNLQTEDLESRTTSAQELLTSSGQLEFLYGTDGTDGALEGMYNSMSLAALSLEQFRTLLSSKPMPTIEYTMDFTKVEIDAVCMTDDGFHVHAMTQTSTAETNFEAAETALDAELTLNNYVQGLVDGLCGDREVERGIQQAMLDPFVDVQLYTAELTLYKDFETALGESELSEADLRSNFALDDTFTPIGTTLTVSSITPYAAGFCSTAQDAIEASVEAAILVETNGEGDTAFGEWLTEQTVTTQCDAYAAAWAAQRDVIRAGEQIILNTDLQALYKTIGQGQSDIMEHNWFEDPADLTSIETFLCYAFDTRYGVDVEGGIDPKVDYISNDNWEDFTSLQEFFNTKTPLNTCSSETQLTTDLLSSFQTATEDFQKAHTKYGWVETMSQNLDGFYATPEANEIGELKHTDISNNELPYTLTFKSDFLNSANVTCMSTDETYVIAYYEEDDAWKLSATELPDDGDYSTTFECCKQLETFEWQTTVCKSQDVSIKVERVPVQARTLTYLDTDPPKKVTIGPAGCGLGAGMCLDNFGETGEPPYYIDAFTFYWDAREEYLAGIEFGLHQTERDHYDLSVDKTGNSVDSDTIDMREVAYLGWCKNQGRLRHLYALDSTYTGPDDLTTGEIFNTETLNSDAPVCGDVEGDSLEVSEDLSQATIVGMRGKIECSPAAGSCTKPTEIRSFAWQVGFEEDGVRYFIDESFGFQTEIKPTYGDLQEIVLPEQEGWATGGLEGHKLKEIVFTGGDGGGVTSMTFTWFNETTQTIEAPGANGVYEGEITVPETITHVQINAHDDGSIGGLRFWNDNEDTENPTDEVCTDGCQAASGEYFWRSRVEWPQNAVLLGYAVDNDTLVELRDLSFVFFLE